MLQVQHLVPRQSSLYRVPYLGSAGQSLFQKPGGEEGVVVVVVVVVVGGGGGGGGGGAMQH